MLERHALRLAADTQAAILNALRAPVALIDPGRKSDPGS